MTMLGPPNRGNDPLHVFVMAAALVAAAVVGALMGFLLDLGERPPAREAPAEADEADSGAGANADAS